MWNAISKRMKKIIYFISILVAFLGGFIMIKIQTKHIFYTTYCNDYYSVIANTESRNYNQIIDVNGEPNRTIREKNAGDNYIIQLEYDDGRLFVFLDYENGNCSLCRMEVTSPEYRFGRKEIGIGTDKSTIESVYRNSYQGLKQDINGKYYVEDGNFLIHFYFDESGNIYKIIVGKADIRHGTHGWKKVDKNID